MASKPAMQSHRRTSQQCPMCTPNITAKTITDNSNHNNRSITP